MEATLGTLVDRLQGFFGKSYFLVGFLPTLVFLALDVLLTLAFFPPSRGPVGNFFEDLGGTEQFAISAVILLFIFVFGMVILSLTPWMRQLMEGYHLPRRLRSWLESKQLEAHESLREGIEALVKDLVRYRLAMKQDNWVKSLASARREGDAKKPAEGEISVTLSNRYEKLRRLRRRYQHIPYSEMELLFGDLVAELKSKPAKSLRSLDEIHVAFVGLLKYAHQQIETSEQKLRTELDLRFPRNTYQLGPTRLANIAEVHREYGLQRYGMDTELFWLRTLKIARGDSGFYPVIEDAKIQLDFAVAATALLGLHAFLWPTGFLTALLWMRTPTLVPYLVLALITVLSLVAMRIFYEMVLQTYRTFSEAVRSAIDLYRFDLLRALHVALPNTPRQEKELWEHLSTWTVREDDAPQIQYQHEPPPHTSGSAET